MPKKLKNLLDFLLKLEYNVIDMKNKSFKFRYAPSVIVLLLIVLILSLVGCGWNILNLIEYSFLGTFKIVTYTLIILVTAFLAVTVVCITVYGRYVIKGNLLYTCFGYIKSKTDINDIIGVTHFKKSNKLVAYFKDEKYTVIVITPEEYQTFISTIREINPKIVYDARIDGEDTAL